MVEACEGLLDTLNAGALSLYGLVVGRHELMPKIRRIDTYLEL